MQFCQQFVGEFADTFVPWQIQPLSSVLSIKLALNWRIQSTAQTFIYISIDWLSDELFCRSFAKTFAKNIHDDHDHDDHDDHDHGHEEQDDHDHDHDDHDDQDHGHDDHDDHWWPIEGIKMNILQSSLLGKTFYFRPK